MNWKALAITFIIISIVTWLIFGGLLYLGNKVIEAESNCELTCWEDDNCGSYYYDDYDELCYILDYEGEIIDTLR